MQRPHAFRSGLLLAALLVLMMLFWGDFRLTDALRPDDPSMRLFLVGVPVGAFLASLPRRLRRKDWRMVAFAPKRCLLAFGCGTAMLLGAKIAGMDDLRAASGTMQGSLSALAFAVTAALTALLTAWLAGRRAS